jgi:hypothetical protein|tara:strand:+ start:2168 stop:2569 length:402 start_codon:yes stop_codon:yes gene_type:complete
MSIHDKIKRVIDQSYGPFSDGVVERMAGTISRLPEIAGARARITELEAQLHTMKTARIIEAAVRNPSVSEYIAHWEGRAEKAEARVAELKSALEWYAENVSGCRKLGLDGDIARGKLDRDGGTKAREALKAKP